MPARLHHERIAKSGASPARWLLLTHGIYGAGMNWRGVARHLTDRRTDWGVVLVDLRQHGKSEPGAPPHTIAACAEDIVALAEALGDLRALAGHSFGGKVVLAARASLPDLLQTWMLDSSPSARPDREDDPENTVSRVLELMQRLPRTWAKRDDFVAAVIAEGHAESLARWLAMNLVPQVAGAPTLVNRLDLDALHALLADYYRTDLWAALDAPAPGEVHVVVADRSNTLTAADQGRLAASPSHVRTHHLAAGHWLHIDAPAAVVDLFAENLP